MVLLIRKRLILKYFTTHILTNSAENKKDLTTNYQIPQEKITVMPYLIKDFFIDLKFGDDRRNELIISFVARLHKSKGQENIINEMPLLVSKIPNIKLFIIGDGPEKNYLEQLIVEKKLKENVVLTGAISQNKLFNYMYQSFAHISASEEEAFGLVNVEALAAGTPIIVNKVGGIKDILIEGINGYAFNPKQQGDLTDKLMILLKGDWIHYSLNARNSFLNNYLISQENLLNQLKTLESIMQNNKALTKQ
jgi:glycosyltransferase involved in cell wall biosynthesis